MLRLQQQPNQLAVGKDYCHGPSFLETSGVTLVSSQDISVVPILQTHCAYNQKQRYQKLLCIGHRGAQGLEPENTLLSIQASLKYVDRVEFDVQLTRAKEVVVFHDLTVERTTNGRGKVADLSLSQIQRLDAGKGQHVPHLKEVLELVKLQSTADMHLEIKGADVTEASVKLVKLSGMENKTIFVSFLLQELKKIKSIDPSMRVAALFEHDCNPASILKAKEMGACEIGLDYNHIRSLSRSEISPIINIAHQMGIKVHFFTVNTLEGFQFLSCLGVDGICSDRPDLLRAFINKQQLNSGNNKKSQGMTR